MQERISSMTMGGKFKRDEQQHRQGTDSSGDQKTSDSGKGSSDRVSDPTNCTLQQAVLNREQQRLDEIDAEEYCDYTK